MFTHRFWFSLQCSLPRNNVTAKHVCVIKYNQSRARPMLPRRYRILNIRTWSGATGDGGERQPPLRVVSFPFFLRVAFFVSLLFLPFFFHFYHFFSNFFSLFFLLVLHIFYTLLLFSFLSFWASVMTRCSPWRSSDKRKHRFYCPCSLSNICVCHFFTLFRFSLRISSHWFVALFLSFFPSISLRLFVSQGGATSDGERQALLRVLRVRHHRGRPAQALARRG